MAALPALEALALTPEQVESILDLLGRETVVLSTCNRVEVYAAAADPTAAAARIQAALAETTGEPVPPGYLHVGAAAARHLFRVACGLDSMLVGEEQIRGQVRRAYESACARGAAGPELHPLFQRALRLGKRAQAELSAGRRVGSLVDVAVAAATSHLGSLTGRSALLVGAGATGHAAAAALHRAGVDELLVANRTPQRAGLLAERYRGRAVPFEDLAVALSAADVVVCSTSAREPVLPADLIAAAAPLVLLDLALPHDVDPAVRDMPDVRLVTLEDLGRLSVGCADVTAATSVSAMVNAEVDGYLTAVRHAEAGPAINALHELAGRVVEEELQRLYGRAPRLPPEIQSEVERAARRIARRLLHGPTIRARSLAQQPGGGDCLRAIGELFTPRA